MSIVKRLGRVISSNVSALLDKVEDPAKLADLALADMDKAIREGKRATTECRGEAKRHEDRAKLLRTEGDGWYKRAAAALRAGQEPLARDALARRHELLTRAVAEEEAAREARTEEGEIAAQLARLQVDRDTFAARKGTLVTEARLRRSGGKGLSGKLGATGKGPTPLEQYEEFERQVDAAEAEKEVDDLLGVGKDAQIEGRFRKLEAGAGVDDELAALKARLDRSGKSEKPGP